MDCHRGAGLAQLAFPPAEPSDQLLARVGGRGRGGVTDDRPPVPLQDDPAESCRQVRLSLAMLPGLEAGPQPVPGLDLGLVAGRHLGAGAAVLGAQGLQHGRHGVPVQGVQPPDVPGEQVIVHHAPVLGPVDPHDVVVVEVLEPGPVPRFAVFPVAGALGPDHVWRYPQRDLPVDSPLALADLRVAVLDPDVVAEEPRRLAAGVGDQGFLLAEFQPEGLPEERGQPGLDLLGFGLRPGKSQYVIIRVPYVLQAAVTGVHRVGRGKRAQLLSQVTGCRPVPAPPRAFQLPGYPLVFRIGFPAGSPRIPRDQFPLDEFAELVQVDVTEDRGRHAAL